MAVLGRTVITLTVRCEACDGTLVVSCPADLVWGEPLTTASLLGSERVYLSLFAETHVGPFLASAEA